jgi:hypothetical protein
MSQRAPRQDGGLAALDLLQHGREYQRGRVVNRGEFDASLMGCRFFVAVKDIDEAMQKCKVQAITI